MATIVTTLVLCAVLLLALHCAIGHRYVLQTILLPWTLTKAIWAVSVAVVRAIVWVWENKGRIALFAVKVAAVVYVAAITGLVIVL